MKLFFLLLISAISFDSTAQSSIYHPFPTSNSFWNYHYLLNCINGQADENYSILISGDTIINSQTYHKLKIPYVISNSSGVCEFHIPGYLGAFRNDTVNKKVFFVPPTQINEQLLYDFNMQIGDTIRGYLDNINLPTIVTSIDSVIVVNSYRKRWNIACYNIEIIEGIGNTYGLIESMPGCATDMPNYILNCHSVNNSTVYPDSSSQCDLITNIEFNNSKSLNLFLFPNPFHNTATLKFSDTFLNGVFMLNNSIGKTIKKYDIKEQYLKIYRDNLNSGIYYYNLISKKGDRISGKFIIE